MVRAVVSRLNAWQEPKAYQMPYCFKLNNIWQAVRHRAVHFHHGDVGATAINIAHRLLLMFVHAPVELFSITLNQWYAQDGVLLCKVVY